MCVCVFLIVSKLVDIYVYLSIVTDFFFLFFRIFLIVDLYNYSTVYVIVASAVFLQSIYLLPPSPPPYVGSNKFSIFQEGAVVIFSAPPEQKYRSVISPRAVSCIIKAYNNFHIFIEIDVQRASRNDCRPIFLCRIINLEPTTGQSGKKDHSPIGLKAPPPESNSTRTQTSRFLRHFKYTPADRLCLRCELRENATPNRSS